MAVLILGTATLCSSAVEPDLSQLILVASAETSGQITPCSCPQEPRGGLAHRGALLREVSETAPLHLFVELGEVLPKRGEMENPIVWAHALGCAYGEMGYDVVILGERDASLGADVVEAFAGAFRERNPNGQVAYPKDGSGGFALLEVSTTELMILCVVLWPPVDVQRLNQSLGERPAPDLTLGLLHGSVVAARAMNEDLQALDLLVVGDGAKFPEIQWTEGIPTAGPGTRGRTLSFVRFAKEDSRSWGLAAYRLVGVGDHLGVDPQVRALIDPLVQARRLTEHPEQAGFLAGE
jgi:hypothetical protein